MNEEFSDDLKQAIKDGFVVIDERTRTAIVGANVRSWPETAEGTLILIRRILGLRSELTMRHGYVVL